MYFCKKIQTQLKRHISTKHSKHPVVKPMLKRNTTQEQDRFVADFQRRAIQDYNLDVIRSGNTNYIRERKSNDNFVESQIKQQLGLSSSRLQYYGAYSFVRWNPFCWNISQRVQGTIELPSAWWLLLTMLSRVKLYWWLVRLVAGTERKIKFLAKRKLWG